PLPVVECVNGFCAHHPRASIHVPVHREGNRCKTFSRRGSRRGPARWTPAWQKPSRCWMRQNRTCIMGKSYGQGAQQCCAPTRTNPGASAVWRVADIFTAQQKRKKGHAECAPCRNQVGAEELCFLFDVHFDFGGDVAEHLDGHREFAQRLDRVFQLHLALINAKALRLQPVGNIPGRHRAEHLVVLPGLPRELHRNAREQLRLLLRGVQLRRGLLCQRAANAFERLHVAGRGFDGQLVRQKKIARVSRLHGNHVAAVAELIDIFLKNDLHNDLLIPLSILLDEREIHLTKNVRWKTVPHCADFVRNDNSVVWRFSNVWPFVSGLWSLGHHRTRRLRARRAPGKRQQRDIARALDGLAQPTLVTRAHPSHAPGQNLPAFLHELRKYVRALVVDEVHLLDTELADFLLAEILTLAAARTSGSSTWPARSSLASFTASATRTTFAASASSAMSAFASFARRGRRSWSSGSGSRGCGGWRWWRGLRLFLFL